MNETAKETETVVQHHLPVISFRTAFRRQGSSAALHPIYVLLPKTLNKQKFITRTVMYNVYSYDLSTTYKF
jgi:hypothetical protein